MLRGLGPTIARDAPYSGIYLTVFQASKRVLGVRAGDQNGAWLGTAPEAVRTFVAGLFGGAVATILVHPADTIRTRVQLRAAATEPGAAPGVGGAVLREMRTVWEEGGLRAVFAGASARVVKRTISTALVWTLFEQGTSVRR